MQFLIKYSIIISSALLSLSSCASQKYDSDYAFSLIEKQCSFGPRVPGSDSHDECVKFLIQELEKYADTIYVQEFEKSMSYSKKKISFKNIIAVLNADSGGKIMLFSHYDSRPFSSEKDTPTPGANDGGSSTALLISLARYFKENKYRGHLEFVFFDGEDGGRELYYDEWFEGSKHFAENYKDPLPDIAILVDMIGDKDLSIYKEGNSEISNPKLNEKVFLNAKKLKKNSFKSSIGYFVDDDHIALNSKGFRCINLIDMNYEYWHTPYDTPDKCSKKSLSDVAEVLIKTINER